jgi:hypothetical protein
VRLLPTGRSRLNSVGVGVGGEGGDDGPDWSWFGLAPTSAAGPGEAFEA